MTLDLKFDSGKFMVIQHKGVDFQSKSHLVDEITERMTTASVNRSVSRNKQTPHLR